MKSCKECTIAMRRTSLGAMANVEGEGRNGGESALYGWIDSCRPLRGRIVPNKVWGGLRYCIGGPESADSAAGSG